MQFYKFWVRSDPIAADSSGPPVTSFGYSNESAEDALRVANRRAEKTAAAIRNQSIFEYEYAAGPLREPIVEELTQDGQTIAVLTRVRYGALVINSANVFFADIDLPPPSPLGGILSFFGRQKKPQGAEVVERLTRICSETPGLGIRLYRTSAGFRCLVTSRTIEAQDDLAIDLLRRLESDALYTKLCQRQQCFRARLTPKPWRIGMPNPPFQFPYRTPEHEKAVMDWQTLYDQKSKGFATCALVGQFGSTLVVPDVELVQRVHDHFTVNDAKPLA